ncbi:FAS-associated factor 2 [Dermacentor andersoni]|uniref:FAS-associated factor 2 n=1 Tax=Dermacentor andersoni TaxID=34620 RepID=UPI002155DDD9|nr:FAS-associated factor 2-like [Dermacentor andersoni]
MVIASKMAESNDLSASQTEKLLQFQDLTTIEDLERCREILDRHNWDLEVAVQDTLNIQEGSPSVYLPPSSRQPSVVVDHADQRFFYSVQSWRPSGLLGWGKFVITFPFCFVYSTLLSIMRYAWSIIWPGPRRLGTDPLADVLNFIQSFETRYGSNHPVFYQGTYSQALNDAKRELKFLLIYLHGDDHQDTPNFCRDVLSYQPLVDLINGHMLFWACSVNYSEGYRVSQALRENTYPFLAMIVLRDHRMTVVGRLEGLMEPDTVIVRLQQIMADNEAALITARMERDERSLTQSLRQQQDEAYQASLLADQEKERRRLEEVRRQQEEQQRQQEHALQEQQKKEEIQRMKLELVDQIPEEPPDSDPGSIHLVIKLPTGTRLERRFRRSQSLKYLYFYVFCQADAPNSFEIITNFPRRTLPCEPTRECPEPPSFAELGLGKTETVFVHDLEA